MSTAVFYSLSTVCQYLTLYSLLVLCRYVHCCLLQSVHCLSVPHTVQSVGSVSLCPLLSSTVCPLSVTTSHCTVCWFCVAMSTAVFCSLSTVCQYLTLYSLLVLCRYVHCCLLQSVDYLSLPHTVQSVGSVSLFALLPSTVCPLSVCTSHYTVCWFCVTKSTAFFCSLSKVCQYLTLQSVHYHSIHHTVQSVGSVSLCLLLSSTLCPLSENTSHCTVCPLSVSSSHCTFCWFCVTMSTAFYYSLSTVCQYLTLYRLLGLCHYVYCFLLQPVHCLSVPHTVPSVGLDSLCLLLSTTACPLSVNTSHCTVCWFCVTKSTAFYYRLFTVCPYLTLYRLLVFCHYVYCFLLQPVHCLSVPHIVPSVGFVSLFLLLSTRACAPSVSTSHCTVCCFCVTMSTAFYCSLSTVCQYLTLYRLLVWIHYVYCFLLQPVHCLSVPHTVLSVGFVSLCLLLPTTDCPLSVRTSHCTVCWFFATMSTAFYYSPSTFCQYLTLYRLLVLCPYVYCFVLEPVHPLSVPHTVPSVVFVSLSTAFYCSLSTVCQYLTLYRLFVLCHYVHCFLLQPVYCLSVPHSVPSVGFVSLCLLLSTAVCPLSDITSHCTVCCFCVTMSTAAFYSVSTVCQYLTLYRLSVLCHYVYCFLLQHVHCLSVPHTVPSVGFVSLCLLLSTTACPLSVSTSHCTVCWFCVIMSTAFYYSLSTVCQYLTLYRLLVLCRYVHCSLLQSVYCLSVPHIEFADSRQTAHYPAAVIAHTALG